MSTYIPPVATDYILANWAQEEPTAAPQLTLFHAVALTPGIYREAPPQYPHSELESSADIEEITRNWFEQHHELAAFQVDCYIKSFKIQGREIVANYHNNTTTINEQNKLVYLLKPLLNK